jgi:acyl carrier protein
VPPPVSLDDIEDVIAARFRRPAPGELHGDLDLGPGGFGLDSISLVELLLLCEQRFGVAFPFTLFDEGPITARRLLACASAARAAGHDGRDEPARS